MTSSKLRKLIDRALFIHTAWRNLHVKGKLIIFSRL